MKETLHIYTRVSTLSQKDEGTSLDEQKRLGKEKAKELGMLSEVHEEGAKSGSGENITDREVLTNVLSLINQGEIKHLYVYHQDRLSRDTYVSARINYDLQKNGVTVHTSYGSYETDSPQDKLMMGLIGLIADYENTIRSARLKTGRYIRAKQGYWVLGTLPFGFRLGKNKKLAIDKNQSPWVKKMFEWYEKGLSLPEIKKKLDGKVETNRGNVIWSIGSIRMLLSNTHHKGYYTYLGTEIPCPSIVDSGLWDSVNKELEDKTSRRPKSGQKKYDYSLRPLMVCSDCGMNMIGQTKKRRGEHFYSYVCSSRDKSYKKGIEKGDWKRGKYCPNTVSMDSSRTEDVVWYTLSEILKVSSQEKEKFKGLSLSGKKTNQKEKDKEILYLRSEVERIESNIRRIEDGISDKEIEKLSNPTQEKSINKFIDKLVVSLNKEQLLLTEKQNKLSDLMNDDLWVDWVRDYSEKMKNLDSMSREQKNDEIQRYVQSIGVGFNKDKRTHNLKIRLKLPLVGDQFEWTNKNKSPYEYKISKGGHETEVFLPTKVKNQGKT